MASGALGKLNGLPKITEKLGDLKGIAELTQQTSQAASQLGNAVGEIRAGFENGNVADLLSGGANGLDNAMESLQNGAAAAETLTAFIATRKDGA